MEKDKGEGREGGCAGGRRGESEEESKGVRERNRSRKATYYAGRKTEGVRVNGSGEAGKQKGGKG